MSIELVRTVFDAFATGDVAALDDLYTEDYVLELPYAKPAPVRVEGRAAVQQYLTGAFQVFRFRDGRVSHTKEWYDPIISAEAMEGL